MNLNNYMDGLNNPDRTIRALLGIIVSAHTKLMAVFNLQYILNHNNECLRMTPG